MSVRVKGLPEADQVYFKETNASEPSMGSRKALDVVKTVNPRYLRDKSEGNQITDRMATGLKAA
ncbi:MAG: hypothetical protein GY931_19765 [Maribacter sp.]|nr:hypothetical protein [Maribacter sp.]